MKQATIIAGIAGLLLLGAGTVAFAVSAYAVTTPVLVLWSLSAILIISFLATHPAEVSSFLTRRSTKYGANTAIMMLVVGALLVFLQAISLSRHYSVDLTEGGRFTLSDQTKTLLATLPGKVSVIGFFRTSSQERIQVEERLNQYKQLGGENFTFEIVDPDQRPDLAKANNLTEYNTIVYSYGANSEKAVGFEEENLTKGLMKVTSEKQKVAYFLKGHGEHDIDGQGPTGYSGLKGLLEGDNFQVKTLELYQTGEVPEDCSVLVIAGPAADLLDPEFPALEKYLQNSGNVIVMLEPQKSPKLVAFLEKYGIKAGDDMIIDPNPISRMMGMSPDVPTAGNYANHDITRNFQNASFFPSSRSLDTVTPAPAGITATKIVFTTETSWAEMNLEKLFSEHTAEKDDGIDRDGPLAVMVAAEYKEAGAGDKRAARIAVFGDSDFAANNYANAPGNAPLFLNTAGWAVEEPNLMSVRPKDKKVNPIFMSAGQQWAVLLIPVVILPLLVIFSGVGYIVSRRRSA